MPVFILSNSKRRSGDIILASRTGMHTGPPISAFCLTKSRGPANDWLFCSWASRSERVSPLVREDDYAIIASEGAVKFHALHIQSKVLRCYASCYPLEPGQSVYLLAIIFYPLLIGSFELQHQRHTLATTARVYNSHTIPRLSIVRSSETAQSTRHGFFSPETVTGNRHCGAASLYKH
jgi:hypothetical protein